MNHFATMFRKNPAAVGRKLKEVTFYLAGGGVVVIEGVTETKFEYDKNDGSLVSWNLEFDKSEDHRDYPGYINPRAVEAITWRTYNEIV